MPSLMCLGRLYGSWSAFCVFSGEGSREISWAPHIRGQFHCNARYIMGGSRGVSELSSGWSILPLEVVRLVLFWEQGRLHPWEMAAWERCLIWCPSGVPYLLGCVSTMGAKGLYARLRSGKSLRFRFLLETSWVLWTKGNPLFFILCKYQRLPETL